MRIKDLVDDPQYFKKIADEKDRIVRSDARFRLEQAAAAGRALAAELHDLMLGIDLPQHIEFGFKLRGGQCIIHVCDTVRTADLLKINEGRQVVYETDDAELLKTAVLQFCGELEGLLRADGLKASQFSLNHGEATARLEFK